MERHVALVGLPGVGKSTVARRLGRELSRDVVDLDAEIERRAHRSVKEIFAEEGEAGFRRHERAALQAVLERVEPVVLACGGGVVTDAESRRLLGEGALVVWLDADDDVVLARLRASRTVRPLMEEDPVATLRRLRAEREPLYEALAALRVDVGRAGPGTSTRAVLAVLNGTP